MTKCNFCFTDAGDQTCNKCGDSACDRHRDDKGVCPQSHEKPEPAPKHDHASQDEEDDSSPKPRVKVTKPSPPARPSSKS